jgi:tetratricopeptide (TPR) repeat protein
LQQLYERAGDPVPLLDLAERAAETSTTTAERVQWLRSAADGARQAGDPARVVRALERILEEQPGDPQAEDALIALHRSRGDARALVAMLRRRLQRAAPGEEAALHAEAASLLEDSLADPDGAFVHWRRAVSLDASDDAILERALACAEATGGPLRQLDLLELAAAAASLPQGRARLLARRGELLTDALAWTDEGADSWRRSLELDPNQPAVRERLAASAV